MICLRETGKIAGMEELRSQGPAASGDELYLEEWRYFYAERRRFLIRLFWFAGALVLSASLLVVTQGDHYPPLVVRIAIAGSFGLLLIAFLAQWFLFVWEMRTWTCPRCTKRFFFSAFAFDPIFASRCRHCGLLRLKGAEFKNLKPGVH